jgi:hypothetical protein
MLKKVVFSAVFLSAGGFFCMVCAQEAVIKLDSPEQIEQFQKMFLDTQEPKADSGAPESVLPETPEKKPPKKIESSEENFKVYKPQPKEPEDSGTAPAAGEDKKAEPEVLKSEAADEVPAPKDAAELSGGENELKVFIPQAEENADGEAGEKNIKWLESSEDLAEFEELLKKAQFE